MRGPLRQQLEQLRSGIPDGYERKKVLALFHEAAIEYPVKDELYQQLDKIEYNAALQGDTVAEFERLWRRIEREKINPVQKIIGWRKIIYSSAAILILGLIISNLTMLNRWHSLKPAEFKVIAPKGAISEAVLPDGSVIFLNAGSTISYSFTPGRKAREVYLEGEAWFDVEHSDDIPFVVRTNYYDVSVLGTQFNVKAYPEDDKVITTLEKGLVHIVSGNRLSVEKDITLQPGDQLVYNKNESTLLVRQVKPRFFSSWKDNRLIFINMSLEELVTLLERKYGVEIVVADDDILKYHYDGTIKNETVVEVLEILKQTLPISYRIDNQKITIINN